MSLSIRCPHCQVKLALDDDMIGEKIECVDCGERFVAKQSATSTGSTRRSEGRSSKRRVADAFDDRLDDADERPTSRKSRRDRADPDDDYDPNEDDSPRKRRRPPTRKKSRSEPSPALFGGVLAACLVVVGLGLLWMFGFFKGNNNNNPPVVAVNPGPAPQPWAVANPAPANAAPVNPAPANPVAGNPLAGNPNPPGGNETQFTLSNPRWGRGNGMPGGFPGDFTVDYTFTGVRPGSGYRLIWKHFDGTLGSSTLSFLSQARGTISIQVIGPGRGRNGGMTMWLEKGGLSTPFNHTPGTKVSNEVTLN